MQESQADSFEIEKNAYALPSFQYFYDCVKHESLE